MNRVFRAVESDTEAPRRPQTERPRAEAAELVLATCGHRVAPTETRRGLCRTCYRKLSGEGLPLPPTRSRWDDHDALAAWARALPERTRQQLLAALMEVR